MSLVLTVVAGREPDYVRGYAWYRLVRIWGSLRFDDTCGLNPLGMVLTAPGLVARSERTSGKARRGAGD
eukprot:1873851-Alexandrium_andersonii.AAC.1